MLVIACAGVLGWLLMLTVAICLGAAAKRGDELELDVRGYPSDLDAEVIPLRPHHAGRDRPPAWCARRRCD
ncbi:hypothetical protein DVS77_29710 [Mycolicibacterium moriokaense]|nr:hypothetical protein DVS77_29710 [Mycolicibacterium moriokaense]